MRRTLLAGHCHSRKSAETATLALLLSCNSFKHGGYCTPLCYVYVDISSKVLLQLQYSK
jgi:hypothetical protein